jgi:hypothetical protein
MSKNFVIILVLNDRFMAVFLKLLKVLKLGRWTAMLDLLSVEQEGCVYSLVTEVMGTRQMDRKAGLAECGRRRVCVQSGDSSNGMSDYNYFVTGERGSHGDNCQEYYSQEHDTV